jgi:hypothetical protein
MSKTGRHILTTAFVIIIMGLFAASSAIVLPGIRNGVPVPKDSFLVFIDLGNSAMTGRAPLPDTISENHCWKLSMYLTTPVWEKAKEPIYAEANNPVTSPKSGPIMPLIKELHALHPNLYYGVIQISHSAALLANCFLPGKTEYTSIMAQVAKYKDSVTIAGIISMLNLVETENCQSGPPCASVDNYLANVKTMVSTIRSTVGVVPYIHAGYPVLAGKGNTIDYSDTTPEAKAIIAEIAQIPANVTGSVVIPTDSCTICHTCNPAGYYSHYDTYGNNRWGKRAADTIIAHGWAIPGNTPIASLRNVRTSARTVPAMGRIVFDGSNWSVFDKAGKSFAIFAPDGRMLFSSSYAKVRTQKLLPGVYIVRPLVNR